MAEPRGGKPISASQKPTGGDKAFAGGGKKQFFRRRKICRFCVDKIDDINYKDVRLLAAFIGERGKIIPRRISGVCAPHQRRLSDAIKQARNIALLPFAGLPSIPIHSQQQHAHPAPAAAPPQAPPPPPPAAPPASPAPQQ